MIWYVIFVLVFGYAMGRADESEDTGLGFLFGCFAAFIGFGVYLGFAGENGVYGEHRADFHKTETVRLPDSTFGKVDSIYYKVEGKIYNEKALKSE